LTRAARGWIIGHGKSAKPSDGLRAKFPHYNYDDIASGDYNPHLGLSAFRLRSWRSIRRTTRKIRRKPESWSVNLSA